MLHVSLFFLPVQMTGVLFFIPVLFYLRASLTCRTRAFKVFVRPRFFSSSSFQSPFYFIFFSCCARARASDRLTCYLISYTGPCFVARLHFFLFCVFPNGFILMSPTSTSVFDFDNCWSKSLRGLPPRRPSIYSIFIHISGDVCRWRRRCIRRLYLCQGICHLFFFT